jgi:hypothetical protein
VIEYVARHRTELARLASRRHGHKQRFKAPVRVRQHGLGYYASGRGEGVNPLLVTRAGRIRRSPISRAGSSSSNWPPGGLTRRSTRCCNGACVNGRRSNRHWRNGKVCLPGADAAIDDRRQSSVVRSLKQSWRHAPLAESQASAARLDLTCDEPLPELTADFSHVRDLRIRALHHRCQRR